ncbi:Mss4-like protein [Tuber brumale]|nr:Mss4-like protein [Tuber brumale]
MVILGHCHCGQLEWTISLPSGSMPEKTICHCNTCKSLGGGCYSVNMVVPKDQVKFTKGVPAIYTYIGQSTKTVDCYYCPNCTTHAYRHQKHLGDMLVMFPELWDNEMAREAPVVKEFFAKDRCRHQPVIARSDNVMD